MQQILLLVIASAIAAFFGAYLKEKAKSTVTKGDIEEITKKIETVKLDIKKIDHVYVRKYELKYSACLKLLEILDAHISHVITTDNDGNKIVLDKQYTTEMEARKCHNELLLTIDNDNIIKEFLEIMMGSTSNPIIALDKIRQLIREELGFGKKLYTDSKNTWLGIIKFKKMANNANAADAKSRVAD